jgi:hypothetical protein
MRRNRCASQRTTKAKVFTCTEIIGERSNKNAGRVPLRNGAGADKPSIDLDQKTADSREGTGALRVKEREQVHEHRSRGALTPALSQGEREQENPQSLIRPGSDPAQPCACCAATPRFISTRRSNASPMTKKLPVTRIASRWLLSVSQVTRP